MNLITVYFYVTLMQTLRVFRRVKITTGLQDTLSNRLLYKPTNTPPLGLKKGYLIVHTLLPLLKLILPVLTVSVYKVQDAALKVRKATGSEVNTVDMLSHMQRASNLPPLARKTTSAANQPLKQRQGHLLTVCTHTPHLSQA